MIFLAVTKPRRKAFFIVKILIAILVVGLAVPAFYHYLSESGALSYLTATTEQPNLEEEMPGEPIRVMQPVEEESWLQQVNRLFLGGEIVLDLE